MVLYEAQLLLESGQPQQALQHLHESEQHICDLLTYWEMKGVDGEETKNERGARGEKED